MLIYFYSGHKVKKDWTILKDYFKFSIKKPSKRKWHFEDKLSFLMPNINDSNEQPNEFPKKFKDDNTTDNEEFLDHTIQMPNYKEELIKLVKAEPALYDKELKNKTNKAELSKIWNEIGDKLGLPCKFVHC